MNLVSLHERQISAYCTITPAPILENLAGTVGHIDKKQVVPSSGMFCDYGMQNEFQKTLGLKATLDKCDFLDKVTELRTTVFCQEIN